VAGISDRFSLKWIVIFFGVVALFFAWRILQQGPTTENAPIPVEQAEQAEPSASSEKAMSSVNEAIEALKRKEQAQQASASSWIAATQAALTSSDVSKRIQAVLNLRNFPNTEAVHLLANFLNDRADVVVAEAIDTLGFIALNSNAADEVYDLLEEKARDTNFTHRGQALVTAAMVGEDRALPVVSDFISEESDAARASAVRALSLINSPACLPYVVVLLHGSNNQEIRRNSFNVLAKIDAPEALNVLQEYLHSENDRDQAASAQALTMSERPDAQHVLMQAMEKNALQDEALKAVAISPAAPSVFGDLLARDYISQGQKAMWLETLAEHSASYGSLERRMALKDVVEPYLESDDAMIRKEAIAAVAAIGARDTADTLMPVLEAKDAEIRRQAISAIAGYVTPDNYKKLLEVMWDEDQETRRMAFMCVQQFVGPEDREVLEKARSHPDELIRKQVPVLLDQVLR
jgi:HEAT repeat protein